MDLTELMARERGMAVDVEEFQKLKLLDSQRSKGNKNDEEGIVVMDVHATNALQVQQKLNATDDESKYLTANTQLESKVLAIYTGKDFVQNCEVGDAVGLVFAQTNFYAESGGQVFDTGVIVHKPNNIEFLVESVNTYSGYVLHVGKVLAGKFGVGDVLNLCPDYERRQPIMANHTSTHILNFALRAVLGSAVDQKGSLVDAEKLRFDFSHSGPMTDDEVAKVENICSRVIDSNLKVFRKALPLDQALNINGVRAVFGEKYPDPVTVVCVGASIEELAANPKDPKWLEYSVEFCGGTHLSATGAAKKFVILSENGIAKGVRRIIALTGEAALEASHKADQFLQLVLSVAKKTPNEFGRELASLNNQLTALNISAVQRALLLRQLDELKRRLIEWEKDRVVIALKQAEDLALAAKQNNSTLPQIFVAEFQVGDDRKGISHVIQRIQEIVPVSAVCVLSRSNSQVFAMAAVEKSVSSKLNAGDWIKGVMAQLNGKGGGSPVSAQGVAENCIVPSLGPCIESSISFAKAKLQ